MTAAGRAEKELVESEVAGREQGGGWRHLWLPLCCLFLPHPRRSLVCLQRRLRLGSLFVLLWVTSVPNRRLFFFLYPKFPSIRGPRLRFHSKKIQSDYVALRRSCDWLLLGYKFPRATNSRRVSNLIPRVLSLLRSSRERTLGTRLKSFRDPWDGRWNWAKKIVQCIIMELSEKLKKAQADISL